MEKKEMVISVLITISRADYAWSVAESAIRSMRHLHDIADTGECCNFAIDNYYSQPKDNGTGRFTIQGIGKDPLTFFDRPVSVGSKAWIRFCLTALRFVGNEPASKVLQKDNAKMKKIFVGIDISKEKLNVCLMRDMDIIHEDEFENTVKGVQKWLRQMVKTTGCCMNEVMLCAEFTGRYIYPLTVACHDENAFLWMEDPTRIKNSLGLTRGKSDPIDARRIAEYAARYQDKAMAYKLPEKELASLRILMTDREQVLSDRKKYAAQLNDQKRFMSDEDYAMQCKIWKSIIKELQKQLDSIDKKVDELVAENKRASHQMELLKSVDGVGKRVAIAMIVCTDAFTRFDNARQFNCYAGMAPFTYTSGKSIQSKAKVSQRANKHIKSILHMAALSVATRIKTGEYAEYYKRRCSEGKHPLCVLNIIRAKIVSRMFAVIKRDKEYVRNYERVSIEKNLSTPLQIS